MLVVGLLAHALWPLLVALPQRERTVGTIIGYDDALLYDPIVEFVTTDGAPVRFVARGRGWLQNGERVPIRWATCSSPGARRAAPNDDRA